MNNLAKLKSKAGLWKLPRWKRFRRDPIKTGLPVIFSKLGQLREVKARTFFGRTLCVVLPEPVSTTIWRYSVFEEDVCFYILSLLRPGDTFIDIGGHFGFFSTLAGDAVGEGGRVISLEPMPDTRAMLEKNVKGYGGKAHHDVIPVAAGAESGTLTFKDFGIVGSAYATSAEERSEAMRQVGEISVTVRTLDEIVKEQGIDTLRLIKVDAENAEYDVVQGALETVRTLRPGIIIEAGDAEDGKANTADVVQLLLAENYAAFEFKDWQIIPHEVQSRYAYQNLLMVPSEMVSEVLAEA